MNPRHVLRRLGFMEALAATAAAYAQATEALGPLANPWWMRYPAL